MRKLGKSVLALVLAGIMAIMPVGESVAAENIANNTTDITNEITEDIEETDTEETDTEETDTEETDTEETDTEETDTEETDTEEGDTEETDTEEGDTEETDTEETDTEETDTEEGDIEAMDSEDGMTDLEEIVPETEEVEEDIEESEFPGTDSALNSVQMKELQDLASHLPDMENLTEGTDYAKGELVFLTDTLEEAEEIAAAYGGELASYDWGVGVVALPEGKSVENAVKAAVKAAEKAEGVVLPPAWPNYIYRTCSETEELDTDDVTDDITNDVTDEVYTDTAVYAQAAMGYNDPLLEQTNQYYQWQHAMVGSVSAWNAGYTGKGITIAILDTGVNAQTDLNIIGNYDMTGSGLEDVDGHGTHVAGLAAAKANNATFGAGIAPDAAIINIKVLGNEGGYSDWIMRGIRQAVTDGADIINMSLGGNLYNGPYAEVVKEAYEAGVAVFAAASNDGSKAKAYPAAYDGAIAIGAVQQNKGRTYFSNYGPWVKYSAPGWALPSLSQNGDTPVLMSGTSQATPIAAGTAAVILSADDSIRNKSGAARVKALISKMNKGKIAGNGGAAGIVSLPKALSIPVSTATPSAPVFEIKSATKFQAAQATITIKAKSAADEIYYSINGKAPTFKNGVLTNATRYEGAITITGSAKVTVQAIAINSCGKVSKVAKATYTLEAPVSGITITGQNVLIKGKSTTLKATATPSYAKDKTVTWTSSDAAEVTVNKSGKVTATQKAQAGKTYTITATAKDGKGATETFAITVKEAAAVNKVSFTKKKDTVVRGASNAFYNVGEQVTVEKVDKSQGTVTDVNWSSSNTNLATVNENGVVTAKLPGKVTIKATAKDGSGKLASFSLTIKQQISKIEISGFSEVSNGKSIKLTTKLNEGLKEKAPTTKTVQWSVSPAGQGVTIDKNGTVKAAKDAVAGTYDVVATAADGSGVKSSVHKVAVEDKAITKIQFEGKAATIFRTSGISSAKTSMTLTAKIMAKTAKGVDTVSNAVEFTSSNPGVATVSASGATATITATGKVTGTTTITCKATDGSGKKATYKVTVVNPASKLTVTPPAGNDRYVGAGKSIQLSAVFEEEFGSISSKKVTWSSSDTAIATVDKNGKVKGIKAGGRATITATANDGSGMKATYIVDVTVAITKLRLSNGYIDIDPQRYMLGMKMGYRYIYYLSYNNNEFNVFPLVAVEVSNPDVLSASWGEYADQLYFYPNKLGKTKITIKALDGSGTKVTYDVVVE